MSDSSKPRGGRKRPERRTRTPPPDATGRERAWLQERVDADASVAVQLNDGERLEGRVEGFDGDVLVLRPPGSSPVQIRKRDVRYIVGVDEA